jgi:hypothetical protein
MNFGNAKRVIAVHFSNIWNLVVFQKNEDLKIMNFFLSFCRDGNLKRNQVKSEWKAKQQEEFSRRLKVE